MLINLNELNLLRTSAKKQLETATDALLSFKHQDGWFWRDTEVFLRERKGHKGNIHAIPGPRHSTTTQRAYAGLAYADMVGVNKTDEWVGSLLGYIESNSPKEQSHDYVGPVDHNDKLSQNEELNNFKLAHYATLWFVYDYLKQYHIGKVEKVSQGSANSLCARAKENLKNKLREAWKDAESVNDDVAQRAAAETGSAGEVEQIPSAMPGQMRFDKASTSHYFASLHCARGWSAIQPIVEETFPRSKRALEEFCRRQGYYFAMNLPSRVDPPELTFATALYLAYKTGAEAQNLCESLCRVLEDRISNGVWPATRPVRVGATDGGHWHVASVEIALCLSWLYFQPNVPQATRQRFLKLMTEFFDQYVILGYRINKRVDLKGWCNDHRLLERGYIEGWTTAVVCHFLANFLKVLDYEINVVVVRELSISDCERIEIDDVLTAWKADAEGRAGQKDYSHTWFDLPPYCWRMRTGDRALLSNWRDPQSEEATKNGLQRIIVEPIATSPYGLPDPKRSAFILSGKAGTGKTTLVEGLARDLCWGYVPVLTPTFLTDGLEYLEKRAEVIFRFLRMMSRTVIFFDECEELFTSRGPMPQYAENAVGGESAVKETLERDAKDRASGQEERRDESVGQRTIGAFITAGMLPRLQKLHETGTNIVVLATNHRDRLDDAVDRPGRFDFTVDVPHPNVERVKEYIAELGSQFEPAKSMERRAELSRLQQEELIGAVDKISKEEQRAKRSGEVRLPFRAIDAIAVYLKREGSCGEDELVAKLKWEAELKAPSLEQLMK